VVKKRDLRRIFGPNTGIVTGDWRKFYMYITIYCLDDVIEEDDVSVTVSSRKKDEKYSVGKPEGKRSLGRPGRKLFK
jgi:hypothetical protein